MPVTGDTTSPGGIVARARATRERLLGPPGTRRREGLTSLSWSGSAQGITLVVKMVSVVVMTRLLDPADYAIFATAMAVVTTLELFSDLGILPALMRHPEGGRREFLETGWWMNLARGLGLSAVAAALAWPLSRWYEQPVLFPVLLVLASRATLYALRSPGMPTLRRDMDFRGVFVEEVTLTGVGTAVGLALAWSLRSVWAIVGGTLAGVGAAVLVSYLLRPGLPRRAWDRRAASELSHLSRQVFLNTMVMALWLNADRLLGLRLVSLEELGRYGVALGLALVLESLTLHACDVYFSMLTRLADPVERAAWHARVCDRLAWWGMPVLALVAVLAPTAAGIVFDERYEGAGVILAVLVARLMVRLLGMVQFQHLLASARVGPATRAYALAAAAQLLLLPTLGVAFGGLGIALSGLLSTWLLTAVQAAQVARGWGALRPLLVTTAWAALALAVVARIS